MSSNNEQVKQFAQITGATEERAKFFVDAANGELQVALSNFYEGENEDADISDEENPPAEPASIQFARAEKAKAKKAPKPQSNIATLHTLHSSSSEDEEEQGQAFYAGGSERSGQQVLGPPRKNPIKDYVSEIFRSAQQGNLETFDPSEESGGSSWSLYAGTGYRLGQTEDDHQEVTPRGARTAASSSSQNLEVVTLTLWRQGFVINDGELRLYEDPANREFFESITRGEIPEELRSKGQTMFRVDLKDNRHEDRLSARFNQAHTVEHVRRYIVNARPQYGAQNFALMTTFPSKELSDGAQTLKEAGLLNAAILQRLN
uniref:Uncharacterized protein n=1 Tax=Anopheles merus TaxID=30066 RepID=A0A182UZ31_ANOME